MDHWGTGFCKIRNNSVVVNDKEIFNGTADSLTEFLIKQTGLDQDYPKVYKMDELSRYGVLASELLLRQNQTLQEYKDEEIAVVLSNYSSSLDTDLKYQKSTESMPSPALFVYTLPNIVTGEICIRNKYKGENAFFIQESFNPEFMVNYVQILLTTTPTMACLAGWVEVLGDNRDVFLYLVDKKKSDSSFNHSASELLRIYNS